MRIPSKGRVTIPIGIRGKGGLMPNTQVDVAFDGDIVRIVRAKGSPGQSRGARAAARLRGTGDIAMSTEEIMALTRGE